jgi:hypothetical protein
MGKKSSGKTYTSKGERRSSMKTPTTNSADKMLNKQRAWIKGSNPWVTIENPNKNEKDKPFIRVRYNDLQHGSHREIEKKAFVMK